MTSMPYTPAVQGTGIKASIQKLGGYLAGMVMPNITAFIAWGLITALFIPTGWLPNARLATLVTPMISILLPILIGYTGGRMVYGQRGAVVGAIATMGVVVGSSVPQFLGAMIIGPLAAFCVMQFDKLTEERIKAGFEMLVENFSAGIIGAALAIVGYWVIGPVVTHLTDVAGHGVNWLVNNHVLPFAAFIIEPAKVLFLNNAINHGVLDPLGVAQALHHHKSILFMLETDPGPGLGLLLAYFFFGPRSLRPSVPAAIIIQFLGGIHEIYFPYVLMKPRLILAVIAGGFVGDLIFVITGAGLVATPSPGSIFAYIIETPRGGWYGVYLGVILAAATSFAVASMLLGFGRFDKEDELAPDGSSEVVTDGPSEPVTTGAAAPAQATSAAAPAPITTQPTTASDM
jgi:mannitol PTS system EIICBA or EIICB component